MEKIPNERQEQESVVWRDVRNPPSLSHFSCRVTGQRRARPAVYVRGIRISYRPGRRRRGGGARFADQQTSGAGNGGTSFLKI